jgi:hypothetical protein
MKPKHYVGDGGGEGVVGVGVGVVQLFKPKNSPN